MRWCIEGAPTIGRPDLRSDDNIAADVARALEIHDEQPADNGTDVPWRPRGRKRDYLAVPRAIGRQREAWEPNPATGWPGYVPAERVPEDALRRAWLDWRMEEAR